MIDTESKEGILSRLSSHKLNLLIGEITSLMMLSPIHRKFQIRDIADIILPAINANQFRIYYNSQKQPIALVTWAFFDEELEKEYLSGRVVFSEKEINSGDILYFTEFLAPYGHAKKVISDLRTNIFPNHLGKSLRFIEQGISRKKVRKFYGVNYRRYN